jgi:hypothetical protein
MSQYEKQFLWRQTVLTKVNHTHGIRSTRITVTHYCCVIVCLQTAKLQEEQSMKDSDLTFNPTFFTNAPIRGDEPVGVCTDGLQATP